LQGFLKPRLRTLGAMAERYKVQFRTEPGLADEARAALDAAGIQLVSSHGGGTVPPGGDLPDVDTHLVWVEANGEDAAGRALTEALEGKTVAFELLSVKPLDEPD
jgi:hypothetical protein